MALRRVCDAAVLGGIALIVTNVWLVSRHVVPTNSMAPTLLGAHYVVTCESCGHRFTVDGGEQPDTRILCEACDHEQRLEGRPLGGDRVFVSRSTFDVRVPRRWELAAFRMPGESSRYAVKRVLGLPGERVQLIDGRVHVDGKLATDHPALRYHRPPVRYEAVGFDEPFQLSAGEYFVLGDNGDRSFDSRMREFGPMVDAKLLLGKPFFRYGAGRAFRVGRIEIQVPDFSRISYIR